MFSAVDEKKSNFGRGYFLFGSGLLRLQFEQPGREQPLQQ